MNLKSVITLIIVIAFTAAFGYVVAMFANESMANNIVSAFIPVATQVVGFYIGYQTAKVVANKDK